MILEIAPLTIRDGQCAAFEAAFRQAESIIASMPGYLGHELQRCIEQDHQYVLLVRWNTLADHEVGFRQSREYQEWKRLLHHFYDPFPTVLHYANAGAQPLPGAPMARTTTMPAGHESSCGPSR